MHAKLLQSCLTLCDNMNCSQPGSSVHAISQARILGWVVMPSSRESSPLRDRTCVSFYTHTYIFVLVPMSLPDYELLRIENRLYIILGLPRWLRQ